MSMGQLGEGETLMERLSCFYGRFPKCICIELGLIAAFLFLVIQLDAQTAPLSPGTPITGVLTVSSNHHYFKDANGAALILNGSQTWNTFQDWGTDGSLQTLDFNAFVNFLTLHGTEFHLAVDRGDAEVLWSPNHG